MLLRLCSECLCSPMCVSDATGDCYVGSESNQHGRSDNAAGWVNARRWSGDAADLMATVWCRVKNWIAQQDVWQRTVVFQLTDIFFIGQEIGVSLIRSKVLHQQLSRINPELSAARRRDRLPGKCWNLPLLWRLKPSASFCAEIDSSEETKRLHAFSIFYGFIVGGELVRESEPAV